MNKLKRVIKGLVMMTNFFKYIQKDKKREKLRRYVIREILKTEQEYINDLGVLEIIRDTLKDELTIMRDQQIFENIFMNVSDIRRENQKFYDQIQRKTQVLKRDTTIFDDVDVKGFEVYYSYCRNYNNSQAALEKLLIKYPQLQKSIQSKEQMRGQPLSNFLIKPIQRLPKYNLLMKELIKGTIPKVPEMQNVINLLQEFERLNDENNKSMDKFINRARVEDLSKEYQDESIYNENKERQFIFVDTANIIKEGKELNVRFYVLTDMILIGYQEAESKARKALKYKLDSYTIVKDSIDQKYFTNLFSIVTQEEVILFKAQNKEMKEKSIQQIQAIIQYIKEKTSKDDLDPITVKVVGTEERFSYSINKYTIYIVEIEIAKIVLKIYIRFSKALELLKIFQKRYPQAKFEEISSYHWLNNHSTKVIEQRMIAIERMIQQALILNQKQPEKLKSNEQSILSLLTLPQDFYDLPKMNQKIDIEIKQQFKYSILKVSQQIQQGVSDILDSYFSARNSQIRVSTIQDTQVTLITELPKEQIEQNRQIINVYLIDNKCEKILISEITRAAEIVKVLAESLKLKYYKDFKLILEDKYLNRRVIDDDEVILQLHKINVTGVFNSSINKIEQFWTNSDEEKLFFRKVIYLDPKYEFVEINKDQVRMEYMVLQFFEEIRELKFLIQRERLFFYIAFYFLIKEKELKHDNIQKYLKREVYDQIQPKEWEIEIKKHTNQIKNQLSQFENEKKSKVYLYSYHFLLNIYQEKEATMNIYKLEVHRELDLILQKNNNHDIKGNIFIGLSQQFISFLTLFDKKVVKQIPYHEIENIRSFPNKLVIHTKSKHPGKGWKFITFQSFEIKMLINFYKELSMNQS